MVFLYKNSHSRIFTRNIYRGHTPPLCKKPDHPHTKRDHPYRTKHTPPLCKKPDHRYTKKRPPLNKKTYTKPLCKKADHPHTKRDHPYRTKHTTPVQKSRPPLQNKTYTTPIQKEITPTQRNILKSREISNKPFFPL